MKTYSNSHKKIISFENLILAWKKARKGKTKKDYVIKFEDELFCNLMALHYELKFHAYSPRPLVTFILRDPKTRVISKSDFRDRIVHHAICNIIEPIFDKTFIHDSCSNRKNKGNLFALMRLQKFIRKISKNGLIAKNKFQDNNFVVGYCLKADIKHYFQEVDHNIRYVDDFVILHRSKEQLVLWKEQINNFLKENLKIELHSQKSRIIPLSKGIDFVGFRNFYHYKLPRKRNIRKMQRRIQAFLEEEISYQELMESYQGWQAYVKWSSSLNLRRNLLKEIQKVKQSLVEKRKTSLQHSR